MHELLVPGVTAGYVIRARPSGRSRTEFDLTTVFHRDTLVSIDSRIANQLVGNALPSLVTAAERGDRWQPEFRWKDVRFDFGYGPPEWPSRASSLVEVKSSNLRRGSTALFPDAPTRRGTHHLRRLTDAAGAGIRATLVMMVQRDDVESFAPHRQLDPEFGQAWDDALRAGVDLRAYTMRVRPGGVGWGRPIPVEGRRSVEGEPREPSAGGPLPGGTAAGTLHT